MKYKFYCLFNNNLIYCNVCDMNSLIDVDVVWMCYALLYSNFANISGEVSIGSVLVYRGSIIGYGWNSSILCNDPTAHAEIVALRAGGKYLGNYRLAKTILYVTLEPCIMCVGAIITARIARLVFGAKNNKVGWLNMWISYVMTQLMINHGVVIRTGVLETACSVQITNFFRDRR